MRTVLTLAELQRRFLDALYAPDAGDPSAWIEGGGLTSAARLAIYRHSGEEIHAAALRTAYPAVRALAGDAYFDRVARQYRLAHPSRSGNLQTFGDAFGTFLETRPETAGLRYLGDVARLEWHRQLAALAADAVPLSADAFVSRLAMVEGPIRIGLHPGLRMFASAHPVLTIWQFAMQPTDAHITLPDAGDHVLIWRDGGQVAMSPVHAASFACIEALLQGLSVDAAHEAAHALDPEFDLPACVTGLLQNDLVMTIESLSPATMERSTWSVN
ncbi:MAG: DUF2063 domain-containing protein [Paraburkholderia sp.]|uniref:HvfC/BufC N-terminal domain-containing protein n=1 Tax=Paraburkholderia sp. TaxID=1926495 RepID=UPI0011F4838D|nr:DNA-binding domain-containing protein [Paraburkholderia sp.]TAM05830.1 MAG: DUF2063 domain-containing protein [Paraburkholderia sp.]